MIIGSVEPQRRGGFLSANSSVQHIASGFAAYLGGILITQTADGRIENFGAVGWIATVSTLATLWLAGRVRRAEMEPVTAAVISMAAAAEATADASEPMIATSGER
jgi:DHA1 family inner membrane transport protein